VVAPQAKVEVRFNGTTWVDVSGRVDLSYGIAITRGRSSEADDPIAPGTLTLTLTNDDGRFSPGLPSSPYYPYVKGEPDGPAIRVSAWANGAWRARFWGTVTSWSVGWLESDEGGRLSVCTVTATDILGSLPSATLRQASDEVLRRYAPTYYWPLRDTASPAMPSTGSVSLSDNGKEGWAAGGVKLELDEGDVAYPLFKSTSAGLKLTSPAMPRSVASRVALVVFGPPTDACDIIDFGAGSGTLRWDGAGFVLSAAPADQVIPDSWPVVIGYFNDPPYTSASWHLVGPEGSSFGVVGVPSLTAPTTRRLVLNPTLSGGAEWSAGHLVVDSTLTMGRLGRLLYSRSDAYPSAPAFVLSAAAEVGQVLSITGALSGAIMLPPLEGRDAADVMGAMLTGTGARLVDDLAGGLRWVPMLDLATPVALPAGEVSPGVTWQTDSAGWRSDVTVKWPDDTEYAATRPDGKRVSMEIEGVNPTRAQDRSMADWLVNTASGDPRLPMAPYDLATMTEAQKQSLCSVGPSTRVTLSGLPTQMPSTLACVCEGTEEQIGADSWTVTLKLSPDPVSLVGVYGTSTYDSGAVYAP
jgi:hypothetical protein